MIIKIYGSLSLHACRFTDNWTDSDILVYSLAALLTQTEWFGNRGALLNVASHSETMTVRKSVVIGNTSHYKLFSTNGTTPISLEGLTVAGNRIERSDGSVFLQSNVSNGRSIRIRNCLFWRNVLNGSVLEEAHFRPNAMAVASPDIGWSLIDRWSYGTPSTGVITQNPGFVDLVGPDGIPCTMDGDFRLTLSSPCVDAGDNQVVLSVGTLQDARGDQRRVDQPAVPDTGRGSSPLVDIGVLEKQL